MKFQSGNDYGKRSSRLNKPNKATTKIRENFQQLIENNLHQIEKDLKKLTAKDRIELLVKITSFILPKLKQIESDVIFQKEIDIPIIHFTKSP